MVTWDSWRYGSTTESTYVVALSASLSRETRFSLRSISSYSRYTTVCYIYVAYMHVYVMCPHVRSRSRETRAFPEISSSENRPSEISYDVAMWHFIEASHSVKIVNVYNVKGLWRFQARGSYKRIIVFLLRLCHIDNSRIFVSASSLLFLTFVKIIINFFISHQNTICMCVFII